MNRKAVTAMIAAVAMGVSALSLAADRDPKAGQGMQGMQGMHEGQGTMGMMSGCPMMSGGTMGRGMMSGGAMPQLPPGNEKLQLQMWGEMMQKMSEIAGKYAAQVK
jgi:hypothetical protein